MTLEELVDWTAAVPAAMPEALRPMAESITAGFQNTAKRLMELGLGYLTLDRAGSTLSTGERQRVQLARAVRNRTTGVLYVLDEPSIGLHPANVDGLLGLVRDLVAQGNSVVLVDHDTRVLKAADWLIEMGPGLSFHGPAVHGPWAESGTAQRPVDRCHRRVRLRQDYTCTGEPDPRFTGICVREEASGAYPQRCPGRN